MTARFWMGYPFYKRWVCSHPSSVTSVRMSVWSRESLDNWALDQAAAAQQSLCDKRQRVRLHSVFSTALKKEGEKRKFWNSLSGFCVDVGGECQKHVVVCSYFESKNKSAESLSGCGVTQTLGTAQTHKHEIAESANPSQQSHKFTHKRTHTPSLQQCSRCNYRKLDPAGSDW